jgi:hypothetical protein
VSNLTNLLAFHASGLSFARFGALMGVADDRRGRGRVGRAAAPLGVAIAAGSVG